MGSPFSWFSTDAANDQQSDLDDHRRAPGKNTLTSRIPASELGVREDGDPTAHLMRDPGMARATGAGGVPADDPFGLHLPPDTTIAARIHDKLHALVDDEAGALALLRSDRDRRATCRIYAGTYGVELWTDFADNASGDILHQALALLHPCMTLVQRLESHMGTLDDDEGAILQEILDASTAELKAAPIDQLEGYIRELPAADAYKARCRAWPQDRVLNLATFLKEADGYIFDDEGPVATALLAMTPKERFELWNDHQPLFAMFSTGDKDKIRRMCESGPNQPASQADAIAARMELATEGLGTDEDGALAAVAAAGHARDELARVNTALATGTRPDGKPLSEMDISLLQRRRAELGGANALLEPTTVAGGKLDPDSFLGSVQDDMGSDAVDQAMTTARASTRERTKQLLLGTIGVGGIDVDEEAALRIMREVQSSDPELRVSLLNDPDLGAVWAALNRKESNYVVDLAAGRTADAAIYELTDAFGKVDTDEHRILDILCGLTPADRGVLMTRNPPILDRIRNWPFADRRFLRAFDEALTTGRVPALMQLDAAYGGAGTDKEMANDALGRLSPDDRARFRRGYLLARRLERGESKGPLSVVDQEAVEAFRGMRRRMQSELSEKDLDEAIERLIGLPSVDDMKSDAGRFDAAAVMLMRQRDRLTLHGGITYSLVTDKYIPTTDLLTTTDDAAASAHVAFEARYNAAIADGELSADELGVLIHLDNEFNARFREYADTTGKIAEIAGTVAAVAAAAVVIIGSGGTAAAPTVAAWLSANSTLIGSAAAASALSQVVVTEAAGGSFNDMWGTDGAKQALAGALNGALAVCGAALAEKVAAMVGLSGRALTAQIARSAVDATAASLPGKAFARGVLMGVIDGALGGAVGELAMTLADAETYRRTLWQVMARAGESLLRGGLTGGAAGAATGGVMETVQRMVDARGLRNVEFAVEPALGPRARFDFELHDPLGSMRLIFGADISDGALAIHVEQMMSIRRALKLRADAARGRCGCRRSGRARSSRSWARGTSGTPPGCR
jgi:hypothetical protein